MYTNEVCTQIPACEHKVCVYDCMCVDMCVHTYMYEHSVCDLCMCMWVGVHTWCLQVYERACVCIVGTWMLL